VPSNCGGSGLTKLPETGDTHEECSVLCSSALRFDNRLCVMGHQGIEHSRRQSAVTNFDRAVFLHSVTLKGQYLFIHDDAAMQRGEACTYVYEGNAPIPQKLVVSFHCVPVQRVKAKHFIVRSVETSPGVTELKEFQFAGDTEAHAVPISIDQHLNVMN